MENVLLIVHLIIAIFLIAVVLLQRSEGGALGIGGGGGGMVSARGAASALSKVTWALAIGFLCTSIVLTVLSGAGSESLVETGADGKPAASKVELPTLPKGPLTEDGDVPLPPASGTDKDAGKGG